MYELAARVAARHPLKLREGWLNDGVKGFLPGADPNAAVFYDHPSLTVSVASPRYLFVLKAMSARESDEDDLRVLYPLCNFASADEALDSIERAYPTQEIKPVVQHLVKGIAAEFPNP